MRQWRASRWRLDERIARSPVGDGFLERAHFADACASLWIDGEDVHLEDLVLHDATRDIRTPTHELTIARDVLKTRRRLASQPPGWALSSDSAQPTRAGVACSITWRRRHRRGCRAGTGCRYDRRRGGGGRR